MRTRGQYRLRFLWDDKTVLRSDEKKTSRQVKTLLVIVCC